MLFRAWLAQPAQPHAGRMRQALTAGDDTPQNPQPAHAPQNPEPTDSPQDPQTVRAQEPGLVVRAGTPAALLSVVPHLLGFVPEASLVVIGTGPPRDRIRVTLRYDLPDPAGAGISADLAADALGILGAQRLPAAVAVG